MKKILIFILVSFSFLLGAKKNPQILVPKSKFNSKLIDECSGIVKSKQFNDLFWVLNDSGDSARIFAVNSKGNLYIPEWAKDYKGLFIKDAVNIDWEDIAINDKNELIIGACGNNGNSRKDLAVYIVKEPNPLYVNATRFFKKIDFSFPDQREFPPKNFNFDCEAVFFFNGKIHFLTKHRSDTYSKMYRMDTENIDSVNKLTYLGKFNAGGMVTAADVSPNNKNLAILTYNGIFIFELKKESINFFEGQKKYLPISAKQCESITFINNETLIIANEQMEIFEISLDKIPYDKN